jgi:PAS domain S-box-containing protein
MSNTLALKNRRVLVIDDNREIHGDFRKILSPGKSTKSAVELSEMALFGTSSASANLPEFEVDSAFQGQEGVQLVQKALDEGRPYAMAFVDVRMPPGLDGIETTSRIWAIDPNVQIVICTAYSDYSWSKMYEKLGNSDRLLILKKPFDSVEASQLALALTEKWSLQQQSLQKMGELESHVAERTQELRLKSAFLEAQVNSSTDGILVVDKDRNTAFHNQRFIELFRVPSHIAEGASHEQRTRWLAECTVNPEQSIQKVEYLYSHPTEISRDQILLKDGTTLDRTSFSAIGKDGKYYGRVWTYRDVTREAHIQDKLRVQASTLDAVANAIVITDGAGVIEWVNPAFTALTGYTAKEAIGQSTSLLKSGVESEAFYRNLWQTISAGHVWEGEITNRRKDGSHYVEEMTITPMRNAEGAINRYIAVKQDVTERKQLESQLFQSQKMETVGKLAGGIAHEFNSILTAIIGRSELLLCDLPAESPAAESASEIGKAAYRAADLTQQLLAYGRKQILQPQSLNLNDVLAGMEAMLHPLTANGIDMQIVPAAGLSAVKADPGQVAQVITNIVMNASEAMPKGGKLTIETANIVLDQSYASRFPDLEAGNYVMLAVTDNGVGMSDEVKARIFEPFFTTKDVGEGAGLGLSTCYGIVKQSGGHISVYSELGHGTTVKVYLPQHVSKTKRLPRIAKPGDLPRGSETILLVEDDPAFRDTAATLLRNLGYTVITAANGIEALQQQEKIDFGRIDLLLTDVVMPHMSGKALADRIRASYPEMKILFTSAYTENSITHQGVLDPGVALLQKPFAPAVLVQKLREVLEAPCAQTAQ